MKQLKSLKETLSIVTIILGRARCGLFSIFNVANTLLEAFGRSLLHAPMEGSSFLLLMVIITRRHQTSHGNFSSLRVCNYTLGFTWSASPTWNIVSCRGCFEICILRRAQACHHRHDQPNSVLAIGDTAGSTWSGWSRGVR